MATPKKKPYEARLRKDRPPAKRARDGKQARQMVRITIDQYNALFRAYSSKPSLLAAAKAAGVSSRTAKTYIDGPGAPELGMEPIAARVARINAAVNEHHDLTYQEHRLREVRAWQEVLKTSDVELATHRAAQVEAMKAVQAGVAAAPTQPFLHAVRTRAEAGRMVEHYMNRPDVSIEVRQGPDPLLDMDLDELRVYAQTGVLPERHRR